MNLIQLALAAEEFFRQQPAIQLSDTQCVRSKNVHASCTLCVEHCPTGAIRIDDSTPVLDLDHCIKCGGCVYACPVGAYERGDGLYKLLNCAENILGRDTLDIVCAHHPSADRADRGTDAIVQIGNCLSELGPSAYTGLRAIGVQQVRVRMDACEDCPLRVLQPQIEQNARNAQRILSAFAITGGVTVVDAAGKRWRKKPLHQSKNPPVSRRGFLTMFAAGNASYARTIVPVQEHQTANGKRTSRERRRLLTALRIMSAETADIDAVATLDTDDFAHFSVQANCTACGLCERVCPTGAITVEKSDKAFAVDFAPHLCTHCGLCVDYCEPGAIQFAGQPSAHDVINGAVLRLHTGTLRECTRCKALFASDTGDDLCDVCRHRRDSFAGSALPDAVLAKLPPDARERLARHQTQKHGL